MRRITQIALVSILFLAACAPLDEPNTPDSSLVTSQAVDPDTAAKTTIDRFSSEAGTLFVRNAENGFPEAGEPIAFDDGFLTQGFGPDGELVKYYNFDAQPTRPAPIYVFFEEGADAPVPGQLNVIDVVPGDAGYNDLWQVVKVTVPAEYVANSITSVQELSSAGLDLEFTPTLVNCPVVPEGSTAVLRTTPEQNKELVRGWYNGEVVYYFEFGEAPLTLTGDAQAPLSPIYVTFNVNPEEAGGGPASGFVLEPGSEQTHNVLASLPGQPSYSPLWAVSIYDNADFDSVLDWTSAALANVLVPQGPNVNCPVGEISPKRGAQ